MGGQPIRNPSQLQLGDRAVGLETRIQRERQRIERVVAFSLEVARALRQELDGQRATAAASWDEARAARVLDRLAAVQAEAATARRFLAEAPMAATHETLALLSAFDLQALTAATRALQGLGATLREADVPAPPGAASPGPVRTGALAQPGSRAPSPLPATTAPRPAIRELPTAARATSKLDHWAGGPAPRRGARPGAPAGVDGHKTFEGARRLSAEVLSYVGPRLALVQASMSATGLPGPRHPWHQVLGAFNPPSPLTDGIDPPLRPWLPLLARLFYTEIPVARDALLALQQWAQARQLHREAEQVAATLAKVPEQARPQILAGFNAGRLRGAAYVLSHLHARFKGVTHLGTLFPPPS